MKLTIFKKKTNHKLYRYRRIHRFYCTSISRSPSLDKYPTRCHSAIKEPDNDPIFEQLEYKMYIEWKIAKHALSYFITSAAQDIDNCCFQEHRNKRDQINFLTFPACLKNLSKR